MMRNENASQAIDVDVAETAEFRFKIANVRLAFIEAFGAEPCEQMEAGDFAIWGEVSTGDSFPY